MSVVDQIVEQIAALTPSLRESLLLQLNQQAIPLPKGSPGTDLLAFASRLDSNSAREMTEAIKSGCEQVDARDW